MATWTVEVEWNGYTIYDTVKYPKDVTADDVYHEQPLDDDALRLAAQDFVDDTIHRFLQRGAITREVYEEMLTTARQVAVPGNDEAWLRSLGRLPTDKHI